MTLKLEEYPLNTKSTQLDLFDKLGADLVGTAVQREWAEEQVIYQTSTSPTGDILSKQKEGSQAPIELNSSPSWRQIPESNYDSYSKQTTGPHQSIPNGIQGGQAVTDSSQQSAKRFPPLGPSIPPDRHLPTDATDRKRVPLWTGLVKYFPDALVAVAAVSYEGNQQHNPGKPLRWDRSKSMDQKDTLLRHLWESGTFDKDGCRHSAKVAWRALAMLQLEIESGS